MSRQEKQSIWTAYQSAWSATDIRERERILDASVADDCVYADPATPELHGRAELIAKIESSQRTDPGASFKNDRLVDFDDRAVCDWTMYGSDGAAKLHGASYAQFGADGRLTRMSGFFELPTSGTNPEADREPVRAAWDTYQASWARVSPAQRRTLLAASVSEDARYRDPAATCDGLEAIVAYVDEFQERNAGDWFRQTSFMEHHGQLLSRWERVSMGREPEGGASYARFGTDGRLIAMSGFPAAGLPGERAA